MTTSKQVKICVYWKDKGGTTFSHYWIGNAGKDGNGIADRPLFMVKLFLAFAWKHKWISFKDTALYLAMQSKGFLHLLKLEDKQHDLIPKIKEANLNGNGLQNKIPNDSS